ncbi:putative reverse transcriptase domain-containing protein [Tanacetum coccineum]
MPSNTFSKPPLIAEIDSVFGCIKLFPKGISCGRDGLRAQHILDALCGEGSATATDLLKDITSVINLWLVGWCPPILAEFVASAPPTPLLKLDNGIRPIAVGTIWRRLVSKVAMKGVGKEMSKYLSDFQFGVRVSGGAKAVLHSANRLLSEYRNDGSLAMLTMNFSNAFNLVDRSTLLHEIRVSCPSISLWVDFLYGQAVRLYIGDTHILSAIEVQQGDPFVPFLFALVLHSLVHKIKDSCKLLLHAWYLDDGTIIGDSEVLDIIKLRKGLFPVDIQRLSLGVKLLGRAVSRVVNFISGMVIRRSANAVDLINLLPQLHDPQRPFFGDLQWRLVFLPIRLGGLSFGICGMDDDYVFALVYLRDTILSFDFSCFTNKDIAPSKAQQILVSALFSEMVKDMEIHFDMTVRQKAVFECLRAPHAQDFQLAIPIDGLGQHMSPVIYRTILKYRPMIPPFLVDAICPVCRKACLDSFGEHAVHCKELPGFKYRHDMARDVLFDICRRVGIFAKKEAPMNFLTNPSDGRSTLRPIDVLLFGWVGRKHACVDLTGFLLLWS